MIRCKPLRLATARISKDFLNRSVRTGPRKEPFALSGPPEALLLLPLAPYAPPLARHNSSIGRGVRLLRASLPLQDRGAYSSSGRVVSFLAVSFVWPSSNPFLSTRTSTVTETESGCISHLTYLLLSVALRGTPMRAWRTTSAIAAGSYPALSEDRGCTATVLQPSLIRTGTQWTKRLRQVI
jgi:hypothetical protein